MYKLDQKNLNLMYLKVKRKIVASICFLVAAILFFILKKEHFLFYEWAIIFFIIAGVLGIKGIKELKVFNKKLKKIKYLISNGTLVKNLPYKLVDTCYKDFAGSVLKAIQIEYRDENGNVKIITGLPRLDNKKADIDGTVDLLIDSNDTSNYYIDFNIDDVENFKEDKEKNVKKQVKYKVKTKGQIREKYFFRWFLLLMALLFGYVCISELFTATDKFLYIVSLALPMVMFVGFVNMDNAYHEEVKKFDYLSRNAILIKNLPYIIEDSSMTSGGEGLVNLVVELDIQTNNKLQLRSEPMYRADLKGEKIDLLIDPLDLENYYINFNIEEIN